MAKEGSAAIKIPEHKISKKMPVFYNPEMKLNRDISVQIIKYYKPKTILDLLAASGIRSIRFIKEAKAKDITINDLNPKAIKNIKQNLKLNKIKNKNIKILNQDANLLLRSSKRFDYIDLDPFGSPITYLNSAVYALNKNGILAVTATDLSSLSGSYPKTCKRRYNSLSLKNEFMHESAIRILIYAVQTIAFQHEKALIPILSYYQNHYIRIYFKNIGKVEKMNQIMNNHNYILYCKKCLNRKISNLPLKQYCSCKNKFDFIGPLYTGSLQDKKLLNYISKNLDDKLIKTLKQEIETVGFYNFHKICKAYKRQIPKFDKIIKKIKSKNYKISKTHFSPLGIKTDMPLRELIRIIRI